MCSLRMVLHIYCKLNRLEQAGKITVTVRDEYSLRYTLKDRSVSSLMRLYMSVFEECFSQATFFSLRCKGSSRTKQVFSLFVSSLI